MLSAERRWSIVSKVFSRSLMSARSPCLCIQFFSSSYTLSLEVPLSASRMWLSLTPIILKNLLWIRTSKYSSNKSKLFLRDFSEPFVGKKQTNKTHRWDREEFRLWKQKATTCKMHVHLVILQTAPNRLWTLACKSQQYRHCSNKRNKQQVSIHFLSGEACIILLTEDQTNQLSRVLFNSPWEQNNSKKGCMFRSPRGSDMAWLSWDYKSIKQQRWALEEILWLPFGLPWTALNCTVFM